MTVLLHRQFARDFSLSAAVAGLIALVATYSGPVLVVVQAARAGHLSSDLLSTWIWALSFGAALLGLWFSLRHRLPVIGAWSTPGVALLVGGLTQYPFAEVVGCYLILTLLVALIGWSGAFSRLMAKLPTHLLSAMIAGVMFQFCADIFRSMQQVPWVVLPVVAVYLAGRRLAPRYAVAWALLSALGVAIASGTGPATGVYLEVVRPVFTTPAFSLDALVGLGVPLLLLALTQYATGVTVLRNAGYAVSDRSLVGISGLISMPLSFFGSSGINPAAIVAGICASSECHPDPRRRYVAGVVCALGYLLVGVFGASVVALFGLLPNGLVATLAGLALLSAMVSSLTISLAQEQSREASCITFAVTVSGMSFFGLGSALWGLIVGLVFSTVTVRGSGWLAWLSRGPSR
jgi:benzoate membrane transport protein